MASLIAQEEDEEVGLYFVVPRDKSEVDCDDVMKEAYQMSLDNDLDPCWKSEDECLEMSPSKRNVFVFQVFKGLAYEHLKAFKCVRIAGPRCLLSTLINQKQLPCVVHPIFTAAMRDLVITASGGGVDVKNKIKEKVELMSGTYTKSLTEKVTHVVVSTVISDKYEKALELGIPVMTHDWINAVWTDSLRDLIAASDKKFDRFKCPAFLQLTVCSSGLSIRETERVKNTVIKHGGVYLSSLTQNVNILVVKHPKGDKFKYAKSWTIPCVEPNWIYDSVQNGHALPTKTYEISGGATSSPTSGKNIPLSFPSSDVSTIQFDQRTHIDESVLDSTTSSIASFCPPEKSAMPPPKAPPRTPVKKDNQAVLSPQELKGLLHRLDLSQVKKSGAFLDGCRVFLHGWDYEEEEKLRKILKNSGAARFTEISDQVSHVLAGNLDKAFLRSLKDLSHKPHVVNIKWLVQSVSEKAPAAEEPHICLPCDTLGSSEAPSPLSKKGMALLERENISPQKSPGSTSEGEGKSPYKQQQLLEKYKSSDSSVRRTLSTSAAAMPPPSSVPSKLSVPTKPSVKVTQSTTDVGASFGSQDESVMIFTGLNFVVVGLPESEATEIETNLIQRHGGNVVPKSFKGVADYAVVPLTGATLHQTVTDIVNVLWLEDCVEEQCVLSVEYYHQPIVLDLKKRPLKNCVLGVSGYSGKERQFITELASALGAITQEVFAKKSKHDVMVSTHLVCKVADGSQKYNAAVRWFRPAVRHSWLLACAKSGTKVPEKSHLHDPSQVIKEIDMNSTMSSNISAAKAEASPNIAALKKLTDVETAEASPIPYDKEEISRLINYQPFKGQTPTTLIGFSENPTPGESKRITKFIEKLPGKLPSSPPRRDSTPLNVLRKRLLQAHYISTPEMLGLVPLKGNDCPKDEGNTRDLDSDLQVGTSAHSIRNPAHEDGILTCSTPTGTSAPCTSRKLFEAVEKEAESEIHGQLHKLQKLIEIPEVDTEKSVLSSKTPNRSHHEVIEVPETQLLSDSLKECSQPYAIKWEDPVNVRRVAKDGHSSPQASNVIVNEPMNSVKRKSSENAESEPQDKKRHSELPECVSPPPAVLPAPPKVASASKETHVFVLSCNEGRTNYVKMIQKLGGTVLDTSSYDPKGTHLLMERAPSRSEKLLGFIAAGKWVLHISYLLESMKQGKFIKEEDYEWGNPNNLQLSKLLTSGSVEEALAHAARRWRITLSQSRKRGAFDGFKCKIFTSDDKRVAFTRLICAGGGSVLPVNSVEEPSFCLVNVATKKIDFLEFARKGIPCLPLTFLYEHLSVNPPPTPQSRVLEDYKIQREKYLLNH